MIRRPEQSRAGFALVTVLLVLMALLVLCTPFLWTASNADRTSARLVSDVEVELALDTAFRHARHELGRSHAGFDETRYSDSEEETAPRPESVDERPLHDDPSGVMWSYETTDHAGLIDLETASPHVLANLLGQASYLYQPLGAEDVELSVAPADGFRSRGILSIGSEYVLYGSAESSSFGELGRGFLSVEDEPCGPSPAKAHGLGKPVIGYDAWAIAYWRLEEGRGRVGGGSLGELATELAPALLRAVEGLDEDEAAGERGFAQAVMTQWLIDAFEPTVTLEGGVASGAIWQHPTTILAGLQEEGLCNFRVRSSRWFAPGTTVRITEGEAQVLGLVESVQAGGTVRLKDPLPFAFTPGLAQVEVLARRPVNINVASPEVLLALLENIKLRNINQRISRSEALALVERIEELRPFDGFSDFVERLVIPAAGVISQADLEGVDRASTDEQRQRIIAEAMARRDILALEYPPIIDSDDARALMHNALNANDSALEFSTMPFSFVSRDVHEVAARASINAASGKQRRAAERRQLEFIAPQVDLLSLWTSQEDFDEALRSPRNAPGWGTGPITTTIPDVGRGASPTPRVLSYYSPTLLSQPGANDEEGAIGEIEVVGSSFPSRESDGFAKAWHVRSNEAGPRFGAMEHFDVPRTALEGRRVSAEPWPIQLQRFDLLGNSGQFGLQSQPLELLRPFAASMWVRPEQVPAGTHLLDIAASSPVGDRVELFVDPLTDELVLRVLEGPGDNPLTPNFIERSEVRYLGPNDVAQPGGPLPTNVWSHVEADVRGSRPDQLGLRVDGFPVGRRPGLTRLTAPLSAGSTTIRVESTEGFPDTGPILIGEEVIEVQVTGPDSFDATHSAGGAFAGFGGRLAREVQQYELQDGVPVPTAFGFASKQNDYPAGTPVSIYGYTSPLTTPIPVGAGQLNEEIGPFGVGRVVGYTGANGPLGPIQTVDFSGSTISGQFLPIELELGRGFDTGEDDIQVLQLAPADNAGVDDPEAQARLMSAFSEDGGYAAIMQVVPGTIRVTGGVNGQENLATWRDPASGSRVGGMQILSYSGTTGDNGLVIDRMGIDSGELTRLVTPSNILGPIGQPNDINHIFLLEWQIQANIAGFTAVPEPPEADGALGLSEFPTALQTQVFVVPISLPVRTDQAPFPQPGPQSSEFAQITRTGADAGKTEWVRYDEVVFLGGATQLVRDDALALDLLYEALTKTNGPIDLDVEALGGGDGDDDDDEGDEGGFGGGGFGNGGPGSVGGGGQGIAFASEPPPSSSNPSSSNPSGPAPAAATPQTGSEYWQPQVGAAESPEVTDNEIVSRAARTWFNFRGVLGTYSHAHPGGTVVTPVFRVFDTRILNIQAGDAVTGDPQTEPASATHPGWGWPGANDAVFVVDENVTDIGSPEIVHRAVRPSRQHPRYNWAPPVDLVTTPYLATAGENQVAFEIGFEQRLAMVAFRDGFEWIGLPSQEFLLQPGQGSAADQFLAWSQRADLDSRTVSRLVKFPSGELPRAVETGVVGVDFASAEEAMPAIVDEILLRRSTALDATRPGGVFVLGAELGANDPSITVDVGRIRTSYGDVTAQNGFNFTNADIDPVGGLVRVGDELIAYYTFEPTSGLLLVAEGGRGFLGTTPQPHQVGEPLTFLSHVSATYLTSSLNADSSRLPVRNAAPFGRSGTVRIGQELVHHTDRIDGLGMPRATDENGRVDPGGRGLYRGRYGTPRESHAALTPVVRWPQRYWDRYVVDNDAPEQTFLGLEVSQPDAWIRSLLIEHTDATEPGARLGILTRTDPKVPWSADPEQTDGLQLDWIDRLAGRPVQIARQTDAFEARVFVEYQPGSFDPTAPAAHGWKETPTIEQIAVDYIVPGAVLTRTDR